LNETGFRAKTYRSISEINEGQWNAIVGKDQIFCTHKYIAALEKSGMNEGKCYYVVAYDGDKIVAHASVYFTSAELDVFAKGAIKKIIDLVRRKWKNFLILRSLECGPPIAPGNALSFGDGVDRAEALRLLCHGIEE
jgi:hypothetical protein